MAIVFLYFGFSQLRHPDLFIGWLPSEVSLLPISARTFVILNGAFEVFCGTLLFVGLFARVSALLLGIHLLSISFTIGFSEIGVRDFGLSLATIAIALLGPGAYALENRLGSSREEPNAPGNP